MCKDELTKLVDHYDRLRKKTDEKWGGSEGIEHCK